MTKEEFIDIAHDIQEELAGHPMDPIDQPSVPWGLTPGLAKILDGALQTILVTIWTCDECGAPANVKRGADGKGAICLKCFGYEVEEIKKPKN